MIALALKLLRDELSDYIVQNKRSGDGITKDRIALGNIASMDNDTIVELKDSVIITLVNIEEESTLKNGSHIVKTNTGIKYMEPAVHLNLYVLISATQKEKPVADNYEFPLHRLSLVLQFFQAKKTFTVKNSPFSQISIDQPGVEDDWITNELRDEIKLNVELYTLTFEQINHLWGSLGGKQVPFAMYKVRLVKIQETSGIEAPVIEEIKNNVLVTNAECDE
ncbi:DUF4255 domain-containing protein [uncultured Psychroserpens sp.]|uniref:DUF4255 domain-containing protein n=1 Tax=uncultured Psychroserpens sp. TaxID=255436 RepID=UPI00261639C3|nr:DUF4255 domain-containing protein [uncultured Psychroserpens sp.]